MTDDEITLPPPPSVAYIVTDPTSTEYGLWRERNGPYDGNQMRAFACAAVLLDRQQRAASQGEAVAHVYDLDILAREEVLRENGPVNNAPLYLAPPTPSAEPSGHVLYTTACANKPAEICGAGCNPKKDSPKKK